MRKHERISGSTTLGERFRSVALAPGRAWSAFWEILASGRLARYDPDSDAGLWLLLISAGNADGSWFAGLPDLRRPEDDDRNLTHTPAGPPGREDVLGEIDDLFRLDSEGAGEVLLIRHAQPATTCGETAALDPLLSCAGLEQSERLADRLRALWIEAIYVSPERRALQTAKVIADVVERPLKVVADLREVGYLPEQSSGPANDYGARFVLQPRWSDRPGFSDSRSFRSRVIQALEVALARNPGRRIVVVTHGSVINAYLSMLLTISSDQFFTPEHASISVVRWQDDRYALRCLNDVSHLMLEGLKDG
jgi:2,3-bisphosphoglycerate-dependent phosphoglycerate mutase